MQPMIKVRGLEKTFTLHMRGGLQIPVFEGVDLEVAQGECVVLAGPSGSGKSTLLRALYANYKPGGGEILVRHDDAWVDIVSAPPRAVLEIRRRSIGYASQFLRVIPRIGAVDLVAEPLVDAGVEAADARARAQALLTRLRLPEELWDVPPATFSGGEQQRVNIARSMIRAYPILLLDEPTASLDKANRDTVVALIQEAKARGAPSSASFTIRRCVPPLGPARSTSPPTSRRPEDDDRDDHHQCQDCDTRRGRAWHCFCGRGDDPCGGGRAERSARSP